MRRLLFAIALLFVVPTAAFAHATPISYLPAASSVLTTAPNEAVITFSERIEPGASTITVLAPDGSAADAGPATVDRTDPRTFRVGIKGAQEGTYAVSWQVVSADDGHFTKGAFQFSVGKESTAPIAGSGGFTISHSSPLPESVTIWCEQLGHALLLAVLLCLLIRRPLRTAAASAADDFDEALLGRRTTTLALTGVALAALGAVLGLALKTAELGLAQGTPFWAALPRYAATAAGIGVIVRLAAALAFGLLYRLLQAVPRRRTIRMATLALLAVALCVGAYSRARISHAAASLFHPELSVWITFLHLLSKELWVGAAFAYAFALLPATAGRVRVAAAFWWDSVAAVAIGAVGVTGAYIVWLHLKTWDNVLSSDWGGRFLLLSAAGLLLFAVRLKIVASRGAAAKPEDRNDAALPAVEALFGAALLFTTSIIIITTPPVSVAVFSRTAVSEGVRITAAYFDAESSVLVLRAAQDGSGEPLSTVSSLTVTASAADLGIGPIALTPVLRSSGAYTVPLAALVPAGHWVLDVAVHRTDAYDAAATFAFDLPGDIAQARADADSRHLDTFAIEMIGGALLSIATAVALLLLARRARRRSSEEKRGRRHEPREADWLVALLLAVVAANVLWGARATVFKGSFQLRCEADGGMWMPNVVLADGVAQGAVAVNGCSIGSSHFDDQDAYAWYTRPAAPVVSLVSDPAVPAAGVPVTLLFSVSDVGKDTGELVIEHERLFHTVIVSQDLATFAHVHVEDDGPITPQMRHDGVFPVHYTFPRAGRYLVALDFAVRSHHESKQFLVDVTGAPPMGETVLDPGFEKHVDGTVVRLSTSPRVVRPGQPITLRYSFADENGSRVTDLQPYLGAAMHLAVVRKGFENVVAVAPASQRWLQFAAAFGPIPAAQAHLGLPDTVGGGAGAFLHVHGDPHPTWLQQLLNGPTSSAAHMHAVPAQFGPQVDAQVSFAASGTYVIYGEFRRGNQTHVAAFTIQVQD